MEYVTKKDCNHWPWWTPKWDLWVLLQSRLLMWEKRIRKHRKTVNINHSSMWLCDRHMAFNIVIIWISFNQFSVAGLCITFKWSLSLLYEPCFTRGADSPSPALTSSNCIPSIVSKSLVLIHQSGFIQYALLRLLI